MKTHDDVIKTLGDLTRSDRDWIVQRLPESVRFSLLLGANAHTPSVPPMESNDAMAHANPLAVVAALEKEPAWVAHAVLSVERPWSGMVRAELSQSLRQQMDILNRSSVAYSTPLLQSVERGLASEVANTVVAERRRSSLRQVISRLGARLSSARMHRSMQA